MSVFQKVSHWLRSLDSAAETQIFTGMLCWDDFQILTSVNLNDTLMCMCKHPVSVMRHNIHEEILYNAGSEQLSSDLQSKGLIVHNLFQFVPK